VLTQNLQVFRTLRGQIGVLGALRITSAKIAARLLAPSAKFHYSQTGEDLILAYLLERHVGSHSFSFVDIGCHDPRYISTTYLHYLRGATGVNIDLNSNFGVAFRVARPNDRFVCAAVSDTIGEAAVTEFENSEVNTIDSTQVELWKKRWQTRAVRTVSTATVDVVLDQLGWKAPFDVLLIDVEGHEMNVLKGCSLQRWRPKIIVCEMHGLELENCEMHPLVKHLRSEGYRLNAYATMNGYFIRDDTLAKQGA
jgi:FkbM family methyltransferase